jgi:tetratricopeptide (TPR) repeat protein
LKKQIFLLLLLTALVYLNTLKNEFVWDDLNNIVRNDSLNGPVNLKGILINSPAQVFYRPIPYLTIVFDHRLWGSNPFGYHLTNSFFHIFNVVLIFYIAARLTDSHLIPFVCAALFAVHPVQTEAVTYISGRSDPICAFFLFASFLFYLKSLKAVRHRQEVYFGSALLLFLLGLLSKEIAVVFPFIILAYNSLYLNMPFKLRLKRDVPFLVISVIFLFFRRILLDAPTAVLSLDRVLFVPKIFLYYIALLAFPVNLHMQRSLKEFLFLLNMPFILSALILSGFIFVGLRLAKEKFMRFGLISFFIALLPFSGLIKLNAEIAEHWLYLSCFGFFLFASGMFAQVKPSIARKLVLSIVIAFFSILTVQRNTTWHDDISIYKDTLKYRPNDPKLHYNLGNAYLRKGLLNAAAKEYSIAIEGNPSYAYALNNLGLTLEKQGDAKAARKHYEMAIILDPKLDAAKKNLLRLGFTPLEKSLFLTGFTSLAFAQDSPHTFEKARGSYFDHSLYGDVLRESVYDGKVDYVGLKDNPTILDSYLNEVAELDTEVLNFMPRNEKLAFYLNVYNALTLKVIIDHYPVKSIRDIPGVWNRLKFKVAGRELTLNQIEHRILRKEFKEPRIHFALVCASKGCPQLASEPFRGEILDEQLDREARKFINDKTKVRLDRSNRTLYISSIFKWFNEDFGDVIKFISKYLPEDDTEFIEKTKPKIKYLNYDWSLNEK